MARLIRLIAMAGSAIAAPTAGLAQPQSFDGVYRGSLECDQSPPGIENLHTPLAIVVRNGTVVASAPIFDVDGRQEISAAVATGTVDANGVVHLAHTAFTRDASFHGDYTGVLSATGATLTGTQVWTRTGGGGATRTCKGSVYRG
jgi:hypothetical protein